MALTRLIELNRCNPGRGTFVPYGNHELAVFQLPSGEPVVIDNTCPHAGGNPAGGTLEGTVVTCPLHDWSFDLTTGKCLYSPEARVACYPATLRDGVIYVDLEAAPARDGP